MLITRGFGDTTEGMIMGYEIGVDFGTGMEVAAVELAEETVIDLEFDGTMEIEVELDDM